MFDKEITDRLRICIISLLICCMSSLRLHAQENNKEVYSRLFQEFLLKNPGPYQALQGRVYRDYLPPLPLDSTKTSVLSVQNVLIQYNPLGRRKYLREIQLSFQVQGADSLFQVVSTHQDTLKGNELRKIIKKSPEPLKGEDTTGYSRWTQPVLLIGGSVLGIFGLFFIRSR